MKSTGRDQNTDFPKREKNYANVPADRWNKLYDKLIETTLFTKHTITQSAVKEAQVLLSDMVTNLVDLTVCRHMMPIASSYSVLRRLHEDGTENRWMMLLGNTYVFKHHFGLPDELKISFNDNTGGHRILLLTKFRGQYPTMRSDRSYKCIFDVRPNTDDAYKTRRGNRGGNRKSKGISGNWRSNKDIEDTRTEQEKRDEQNAENERHSDDTNTKHTSSFDPLSSTYESTSYLLTEAKTIDGSYTQGLQVGKYAGYYAGYVDGQAYVATIADPNNPVYQKGYRAGYTDGFNEGMKRPTYGPEIFEGTT